MLFTHVPMSWRHGQYTSSFSNVSSHITLSFGMIHSRDLSKWSLILSRSFGDNFGTAPQHYKYGNIPVRFRIQLSFCCHLPNAFLKKQKTPSSTFPSFVPLLLSFCHLPKTEDTKGGRKERELQQISHSFAVQRTHATGEIVQRAAKEQMRASCFDLI